MLNLCNADAYSTSDIQYTWQDDPVQLKDIQLPQFKLVGVKTDSKVETTSTGWCYFTMKLYCRLYHVKPK